MYKHHFVYKYYDVISIRLKINYLSHQIFYCVQAHHKYLRITKKTWGNFVQKWFDFVQKDKNSQRKSPRDAVRGIFFPISGRGQAKASLEADTEIFRICKSRHERNFGYGKRRPAHKLAGPFQTYVKNEFMYGHPRTLLDLPVQDSPAYGHVGACRRQRRPHHTRCCPCCAQQVQAPFS